MQELPQFPFAVGPYGNPPPEFATWRATEPVIPIRTPAGNVVQLATRHADVHTVLRDARFSREAAVAPGAPRMLAGQDPGADPTAMGAMDPPRITRMRRLVAPAFAPRRVDTWRALAAEQAAALIDVMTAGGRSGDLSTQYAYPLPIGVICRVLGIADDQAEQFRTWSSTFVATTSMTDEERGQAYLEFKAGVGELISAARRTPGTGLLADLVAAHDGSDQLAYGELVRLVCTIIVAGHSTAASVIARGMLRLLMTPDYWKRLVANPATIPDAVEELLRLEVPGNGGRLRIATEDLTLPSGARITAGTAVLPMISSANRDELVFPDPDSYDPGRPNIAEHLSFAVGHHFCIGAALARAELIEAFTALATRLPGLRLDADPDSLPWADGVDICALLELPVTW